jgi:hypothetical protein
MIMEDGFEDPVPVAQAVPFLETFVRISEDAGGDIVEHSALHTVGNITVSQFTEPLDFDQFGIGSSCDWMVIDLPWFQLRRLLEYPGL